MPEDKKPAGSRSSTSPATQKPSGRVSVDDELVPLSVAAQVTYFHLTGMRVRPPEDRPLEEVVRLAALALAGVAPIHRMPGGVLTSRQVAELLIRPLSGTNDRPDLDGFLIRRGDLRDALVSLRKARPPF